MLVVSNNGAMPKILNFGCGSHIIEGTLNLDFNFNALVIEGAKTLPNTWLVEGVVGTPSDLPVEYFTEINARMVLEHIHIDSLPNLLYCLFCALESNGKLNIVVPDFEQILDFYNDRRNVRALRETTFQLLDPVLHNTLGRGHQSLWTKEFAEILLVSEGFEVLSMDNFGPYDMFLSISARKPSDNIYSVGLDLE